MENHYKVACCCLEMVTYRPLRTPLPGFAWVLVKTLMDKKTYPVAPPYSYIAFPDRSPLSVFCNLFPPVYYTGIVVGCIEHGIVIRHLIHHLIVGCVSSRLPYPHPFVMAGGSHDIF